VATTNRKVFLPPSSHKGLPERNKYNERKVLWFLHSFLKETIHTATSILRATKRNWCQPFIHLSIMVATRFVPALVASAYCFQASGFNPGYGGVVHTRLDLHNLLDRPFATLVEGAAVAEKPVETLSSPREVVKEIRELPPVLQQIADERREFQVNLGKAMDTLRRDMPEILKQAPSKQPCNGHIFRYGVLRIMVKISGLSCVSHFSFIGLHFLLKITRYIRTTLW
jgi:hypothetical protein